MKQAFLQLGRVLSTHALSGEVKFEPWGDDQEVTMRPATLFRAADGTLPLKVKSCRRHGKFLLFSFEGIENPQDAVSLRGKILYARREDLGLPENTVFWADLCGAPATDARTGQVYGVIRDIYNRGASDIWEIETPTGEILLFPAAKPFVVELDAERGARILPPDGLFTESAK